MQREIPGDHARRSDGGGCGWCALFAVLPPGQPRDEGVEDGQRGQPEGGVQGDAVELVADEYDQEGDHPGVGPQSVAQQRGDQDDLDNAVQQQVGGAEQDGGAGQAVGQAQQVGWRSGRPGLQTVRVG